MVIVEAAPGGKTPPGLAVQHPDLMSLGSAWLLSVSRHRANNGLYGKVSVEVISTPTGAELHLTEETTFKPSIGTPCPLLAAIKWLEQRDKDRKKNSADGCGRIEFDQQAGKVSWAKVFERTVVKKV